MFSLSEPGWADGQALYDLSTYGYLLLLGAICATPLPSKLISRLEDRWRLAGSAVMTALYVGALVLSTAYLVDESYNPFLYFRF
jgi:alginate O-acetyltransferase complex protein AlgI